MKICKAGNHDTRTMDAYLLEAKDITTRGLFLKTPNVLPVNTKLKLEIILGEEDTAIFAEGRVAWVAKRSQAAYYPGMGVELTSIRRGQGKRLKSFLKGKFRNYRHAVELKKMYLNLKDMAARLFELEESYPHAEHFKEVINKAVTEIDHIAHILDREVWEIRRL